MQNIWLAFAIKFDIQASEKNLQKNVPDEN